ncbi:MAG TPA: dihydropteroate synthase [Candidatus Blautia avistercoris]|uniref:dihydropteroate synthase n=1 Tax=Blautia sp. An249 TaxID=1965603 RepID=UPI000B3699AE|nr:dihydropteroate synthase [Blautia sp. An249]OUO79707.1 dihydropteroate synthase [Blautia sp. An249]HIY19626.1 dihydropteroate synthase [Candidatus Blautia avistercoris]
MKIGTKEFDIENKTYIMGILNVTPDSFSDGGLWLDREKALFHAQQMIEEGAAIIDIGGESTRPGHTRISDQEEMERILPVIEAVSSRFDVPVSVDTYKSQVAKEAVKAGAALINDIWGAKGDPQMPRIMAETQAVCCLMHNKKEAVYGNFMDDMLNELQSSIDLVTKAGVRKENIITDPGVGFGKTYENNLEAINRVEELHKLGCPVLLATSRKSVIGLTLDLPSSERVEGTLATTVLGVLKGCAFVRVHDVKENKRVIDMTEAILGK